MTTIFRFLPLLALGVWLGAIALSFIVAPGIFALMPTRQQAGAVVGLILARLHLLGYVCAAIYLGVALAQRRAEISSEKYAALLVVAMLLLTLVSQQWITPRLGDLRAQMVSSFGSIDQTPQDHALRRAFGRLHGMSSLLELLVLLCGLAAFYLHYRASPH